VNKNKIIESAVDQVVESVDFAFSNPVVVGVLAGSVVLAVWHKYFRQYDFVELSDGSILAVPRKNGS